MGIGVGALMLLLAGTAHASPASADGVRLVSAPVQATEAAEEDDGKIWIAFFNGDYQKPILEERAFLIDLVSFFFFEVGGGIWGPMLLAGAPFDMEWAMPVLVWMGVCWAFTVGGVFLSWTGVGLLCWIGVFVSAWIGTEVALANLDRPSVKLGDDAPAKKGKKK